jgi:hypothetical protein
MKEKILILSLLFKADSLATVGMFDNVLFDNYLDFVQQLTNSSFLGHFFVHATGRNKI